MFSKKALPVPCSVKRFLRPLIQRTNWVQVFSDSVNNEKNIMNLIDQLHLLFIDYGKAFDMVYL